MLSLPIDHPIMIRKYVIADLKELLQKGEDHLPHMVEYYTRMCVTENSNVAIKYKANEEMLDNLKSWMALEEFPADQIRKLVSKKSKQVRLMAKKWKQTHPAGTMPRRSYSYTFVDPVVSAYRTMTQPTDRVEYGDDASESEWNSEDFDVILDESEPEDNLSKLD